MVTHPIIKPVKQDLTLVDKPEPVNPFGASRIPFISMLSVLLSTPIQVKE